MKENMQKYIFDPQNPKQCKSYNLLLNLAKKNPLVFVSSDFVTLDYEKEITSETFKKELWDIPEDYDSMNFFQKKEFFIDSLSSKDYENYIESLEIDETHFSYSKLFNKFVDFDVAMYVYYEKIEYDTDLLKKKLQNLRSTSSTVVGRELNAPKIFFDNDYFQYLWQSAAIFDVASVLVTELKNEGVFSEYQVHKNLKPLYLKNREDVKILLNVLENDLKKDTAKGVKKEEIAYLKSVDIQNFFSIKELRMKGLENKKEIYIVGENGDGKSLLLQALALGLKGVDDGVVFELLKAQNEYKISLLDTIDNCYEAKTPVYKNFFAYGAKRNTQCQFKVDEKGYLTLFNAQYDLKNPIKWLQYLDHSEKSGKDNIVSLDKAKELLKEILESSVEIDITPDEVSFRERDGVKIGFEQLSAGYAGVITIVMDLLARLSENQPYVESVEEFRGVVAIDEVELHLHPKWKYDFVKKLRKIFPNLQLIMTTHSPTVILGASAEAVFYKIYKEDGEVKISNQIENEGYTNNTLVSSPLFELDTVTSRDFNKSISSDDYIYDKIHQKIAKKIANESETDQEKISKLIDEELAKL